MRLRRWLALPPPLPTLAPHTPLPAPRSSPAHSATLLPAPLLGVGARVSLLSKWCSDYSFISSFELCIYVACKSSSRLDK